MGTIRELYKELYNNCANIAYSYNKTQVWLKDLSHFVAMKGNKYDGSKIRLFVIGRAINDWMSLPCETAEGFAEEAERRFESEGFTWIDKNGTNINDLCNIPDPGMPVYHLNRSAFWRVIDKIWSGLNDADNCRFIDHIAWSNLYKIAPKYNNDSAAQMSEKQFNGNPNVTMCRTQFDACYKILEAEIRAYKPTHILLITDYKNWYADTDRGLDFSKLFQKSEYIGTYGKENYTGYVEGTAEYDLDGRAIPAVISCRPERTTKEGFANAVLDAFKNMTV